jgi:hypothetical protein
MAVHATAVQGAQMERDRLLLRDAFEQPRFDVLTRAIPLDQELTQGVVPNGSASRPVCRVADRDLHGARCGTRGRFALTSDLDWAAFIARSATHQRAQSREDEGGRDNDPHISDTRRTGSSG